MLNNKETNKETIVAMTSANTYIKRCNAVLQMNQYMILKDFLKFLSHCTGQIILIVLSLKGS